MALETQKILVNDLVIATPLKLPTKFNETWYTVRTSYQHINDIAASDAGPDIIWSHLFNFFMIFSNSENDSYERTYGSDEERDSMEKKEAKEKKQRLNFIMREFKKRRGVGNKNVCLDF